MFLACATRPKDASIASGAIQPNDVSAACGYLPMAAMSTTFVSCAGRMCQRRIIGLQIFFPCSPMKSVRFRLCRRTTSSHRILTTMNSEKRRLFPLYGGHKQREERNIVMAEETTYLEL